MNAASRDYPAGELRVSDADRDRAVSELSEHFQAGRLTSEEFDERSGLALRARTGSDLAGLFADLPRPPAPAMPPPVSPGPAPRVFRPVLVGPVAIVLAVVVAVLASGRSDHLSAALIPLVIVLVVVRRVAGGSRRRGRDREPW
jgi:hypothetical protein